MIARLASATVPAHKTRDCERITRSMPAPARAGRRSPPFAAALAPPVAALLLLPLADCGVFGSDKPAAPPIAVVGDTISTDTVAFPDGAGLRLPLRLDGFRRGDLAEGRHHDEVDASYARSRGAEDAVAGPGGSTTAITVRVDRQGGGHTLLSTPAPYATTARSDVALRRALARLAAEQPGLRPGPARDVYLLRFGAIQAGRTATLDGPTGPVTVSAWCCVHGIWAYTYVIDGPVDEAATRFGRELPWSASAAASIAEAR